MLPEFVSRYAQVLGSTGSGDSPSMEHLACFVPGMLALGAFNADGTPLEGAKWTHLVHAKALAYVAPNGPPSRSLRTPAAVPGIALTCVFVLFRAATLVRVAATSPQVLLLADVRADRHRTVP